MELPNCRKSTNNISSRPPGERFATTQEADALAKIAGAIKKLESDIGVPDCVSVAMRFLSWLRPIDIDKAKEFNNLFDAFIKDQANNKNKYGKMDRQASPCDLGKIQ